jgi:hypothetical protein
MNSRDLQASFGVHGVTFRFYQADTSACWAAETLAGFGFMRIGVGEH